MIEYNTFYSLYKVLRLRLWKILAQEYLTKIKNTI